MEKVSFRVKLGVMDLYRFLMTYNYKSFGGIFGVLISVACLMLLAVSFHDNTPQMNLVLLALGLLFTVIQPVMIWKKAATQVVKNPVFQEELEYELSKDGISIRQKDVEQKVMWNQIFKVAEDKKQILVYTSRVNACIWPKAQIQEQLEHVKTMLKSRNDWANEQDTNAGEENPC